MTLRAHALAFGFGARPIGENVDLQLAPGEVLCVLGPNGSGKTTLLRTLLGLLPAIAGRVLLEDKDLRTLPRAEVARRIASVPQSSAMSFDFTVEDIVLMGRTAHLGPFAAPGRADREAARSALERLGIAALASRPFGEASGGERQLTLIARALASEARLLLMDEPTASLDFGNQARVLAEISRLRGAGIGVLLSSHEPGHAFEVADRVLLLHAGRVLSQGSAREVLTEALLSRLYGVRVEVSDGAVRARPGASLSAPPPL